MLFIDEELLYIRNESFMCNVITGGCWPCAKKNICCMQVVLNFGGNIGCTITGPIHYSFDLIQDDLEISCRLVCTEET